MPSKKYSSNEKLICPIDKKKYRNQLIKQFDEFKSVVIMQNSLYDLLILYSNKPMNKPFRGRILPNISIELLKHNLYNIKLYISDFEIIIIHLINNFNNVNKNEIVDSILELHTNYCTIELNDLDLYKLN